MAKVTTYPGRRFVAESVGERVALIRVAIGGSVRDQISQEALGELVGWDKYKVSRIERGAQDISRADAIALASVDPLKRGPSWVMFGDEEEGDQGAHQSRQPAPPTPDKIARHTDTGGVPTKQQPGVKGKSAKRKPGDKTAVA